MAQDNSGYFKVYYSMKNWQWKENENTVALWMEILLNTNYEDSYSGGVLVRRGQCITGLHKLSKNTGMTIGATREALNRLKATKEITMETTNHYSLITVTNYEKYQGKKPRATSKTTSKTTIQQQTNNKPTTTNEEEQEEQEELIKDMCVAHTDTKPRFVPPTLEELNDFCTQKNIRIDTEKFLNFYESKGWYVGKNKMVNWKSAVRNWAKSEFRYKPNVHQDILPAYMTGNETKKSDRMPTTEELEKGFEEYDRKNKRP